MKLGAAQNQEIKTIPTSKSESAQASKNDSSEIVAVATDAGKNSKLGEFFSQSSQIKQNLLAKLQNGTPPTGFGAEAKVTKTGDKVTIETTKKDDKIGITQDAKGDVTIEVNGKKQTFSGKDKDNLVIKAGEGNDTVTVAKGVTVKLQLEGEGGNDTITIDKNVKTGQRIAGGDGDDNITGGSGDDKIEAGAGDDTVDGGDGRDYINGSKGKDKLAGGTGNDVVYGGDDDDAIDGGDGDDYLEGGKGNDTITGGKGKDILSGGIGDDTLKGGDGDDVLYAGQGKDSIFGEKGSNKIFSQKDDTNDSSTKGVKNTIITVELTLNPGTSVKVEGSDEFKERVEADLEMLRSSPTSRKMLEEFDNSKHTVTIKEAAVDSGNSAGATGAGDVWYDSVNGKNGSGKDGIINYVPSSVMRNTAERPPVIGLFHEMAHNYDYTHGTLRKGVYDGTDKTDKIDNPANPKPKPDVNVRERVGTGLTIDDDNDPKTPEKLDPVHPKDLTENGLREEMNLPKREHYRD